MGDLSGSKRLYLRVPFRIKEELTIKELHSDIVRVILPRQKSARWCFVEFEDESKCKSAFDALKKKKINGKGVKVSFQKTIDRHLRNKEQTNNN